jgi:hypothetical protein
VGVTFVDQAFFTRRAAGCQSSIRLAWEEDADARQADSSATEHAEKHQQLVAPAKQ